MDETVVIYGMEFSTFVRTAMLCCEEKGVSYRLQEKIGRSDRQRLNNPFKRVPILRHDEFVVFETAAICRYIDRRFDGPSLSPASVQALALMDQWISAANAYFDRYIIRKFILLYVFPRTKNGLVDEQQLTAAKPAVSRQLAIIEGALADSDYFSGTEAGIADYLIIPMLDYLARGRGEHLLAEMTRTKAYIERMRARPSCQKILR